MYRYCSSRPQVRVADLQQFLARSSSCHCLHEMTDMVSTPPRRRAGTTSSLSLPALLEEGGCVVPNNAPSFEMCCADLTRPACNAKEWDDDVSTRDCAGTRGRHHGAGTQRHHQWSVHDVNNIPRLSEPCDAVPTTSHGSKRRGMFMLRNRSNRHDSSRNRSGVYRKIQSCSQE